MDQLNFVRFGASGILIQFAKTLDEASLARGRGLMRRLEECPPQGLVDAIPGCDAILLEFESAASLDAAAGILQCSLQGVTPLQAEAARLHSLPVIYDGPDLTALSRRIGLAESEVIALHAAREYRVYVIGFSPGFPYLGPLDERLHVPRLHAPRTRVPAGSVAIGGEHTGIYSVSSPGGWWLIGRTPVELFSLDRAQGEGDSAAFLLRQGDRVQFVPVEP